MTVNKNMVFFGIAIGLSPLLGSILFRVGIYNDITVFPILFSSMAGVFLGRRQGMESAIIANILIFIFATGLFLPPMYTFAIFFHMRLQMFILLILASLISGTLAEKIKRKEVHWNSLYIILGFLPVYTLLVAFLGIFGGSPTTGIVLASLIGIIGAYIKTRKEESLQKTGTSPPPKPATSKPEKTKEEPKPEPKPEKIVEEIKPTIKPDPPKERNVYRNCPSCGGKISKLNFYKLKAGESAECDFCGDMIVS